MDDKNIITNMLEQLAGFKVNLEYIKDALDKNNQEHITLINKIDSFIAYAPDKYASKVDYEKHKDESERELKAIKEWRESKQYDMLKYLITTIITVIITFLMTRYK